MTEVRALDEWQAFQAMRHFLLGFWERGGRPDVLTDILSWTEGKGPGRTADPAMWLDWRRAVQSAIEGVPVEPR